MKMRGQFRLDKLHKKKIAVGTHVVTVVKKIGEGGSAFIYLAKIEASLTKALQSCVQPSEPPEEYDPLNDSPLKALHFVEAPDLSESVSGSSFDGAIDDELSSIISNASYDSGSTGTSYSGPSCGGRMFVLKASAANSHEKFDAMDAEVEFLQSFESHPNVVRLVDSGYGVPEVGIGGSSNNHYILMEHCSGGSLMDLIMKHRKKLMKPKEAAAKIKQHGSRRPRLKSLLSLRKLQAESPEDKEQALPVPVKMDQTAFLKTNEILCLFRQMVEVVQHLHRNDVVHRDIKPENFLLAPDEGSPRQIDGGRWRVKLCDFGSAIKTRRVSLRTAEERENALRVVQTSTTQMYRAPEMVDIHMVNELTEKSDVWSLGCTLFLLCFLTNCFEENENLAILSANFHIPKQHPYHHDMVELIYRMLTVNPTLRASTEHVLECLDCLEARQPLPPFKYPPGGGPPRRQSVERQMLVRPIPEDPDKQTSVHNIPNKKRDSLMKRPLPDPTQKSRLSSLDEKLRLSMESFNVSCRTLDTVETSSTMTPESLKQLVKQDMIASRRDCSQERVGRVYRRASLGNISELHCERLGTRLLEDAGVQLSRSEEEWTGFDTSMSPFSQEVDKKHNILMRSTQDATQRPGGRQRQSRRSSLGPGSTLSSAETQVTSRWKLMLQHQAASSRNLSWGDDDESDTQPVEDTCDTSRTRLLDTQMTL